MRRLIKHSWQLLILMAMIFFLQDNPSDLEGQYIGPGRPWPGKQSADSLAAVNARITADSVRMNDSLAAAEARITNDSLRLDSLREVLGDSVQENTTQLSFARGLNFDLDGYSAWNMGHLWGVDVYPLIGDFSAGEHGDTVSNKLTDNQSIGVYVPAEGEDDGIQFPFPQTDWGHWTNGDTMKPGETYWSIAVRFDSTSLARQPTNGLKFVVGKNGNSYETSVAKASFGVGWTFISVLLSAFDTSAGSPSWAAIDSCWIYNDGATSADGGSTYLVENPQLVRKSNLGAYPNPFQWNGVDEWTITSGEWWIVNESGRLGAMNPENAVTKEITYYKALGNYSCSGRNIFGTQYPILWAWAYNRRAQLSIPNVLRLYNNGVYQDVAISPVVASGDEILWKASREGEKCSVSITSKGGASWTTNTFTMSGLGTGAVAPLRQSYNSNERFLSAGASAVGSAQYATEAGGLTNMGLKIVKDSLWVQRGDSTAHILVDFFYNP